MLQALTHIGNNYSSAIGMHLPGGLQKDQRMKLQLEGSNCNLEEQLPNPDGDFVLVTHERGFRLISQYHGAEFSSALPFEAITSIEALVRHKVQKKPDFSFPICLLFAILFQFFMEPIIVIILAVMATAIIGMLLPAENVYRRVCIRFTEAGNQYEFTARYPHRKTEEVHGFFLRHLPEKFYDPLGPP